MASLSNSKRVVIKIGSALLVEKGRLRREWLTALVKDVAMLRTRGVDVILVSSGSIALGRSILGLPDTPLMLEQGQAAAAVGQIKLARAYEEALVPHKIAAAQVLVTLEDSANRRRFLNSRATLEQLLSFGVVPIVNENDTIATDEIRFGDNDRLAAQVAVTVGADTLILMSDVDGLYTANPSIDPSATRFDVIDEITPEIEAMAGEATSSFSKGGMKTKVMAAITATSSGCAMVVMEGSVLRPIQALEAGANCTWFAAQTDPHAARKAWIFAMKSRGAVRLDLGAVKALQSGNSLLPAGVSHVTGRFKRGDCIAIEAPDGHVLGYGLARYTSVEAKAIKGHRSHEIEAILGYAGRAALIHRDDMAIS